MKFSARLFVILTAFILLSCSAFAQGGGNFGQSDSVQADGMSPVRFSVPAVSAVSGRPASLEIYVPKDHGKNVSVEVYPMAAPRKDLNIDYSRLDKDSLTRLRPVLGDARKITAELAPSAEGASASLYPSDLELCRFELPVLRDGLYLIRAVPLGLKEGGEACQILSVSNIVLTGTGGSLSFIWAASSESGSSVYPETAWQSPGSDGTPLSILQFGRSGLANISSGNRDSVCIVSKDGQFAACTVPGTKFSSAWKAFLWCESRYAAPGGTVRCRSVLHRADGSALKNSEVKEVFSLSLCDTGSGRVLAASKAALDFNGMLSGTVTIPSDLASGRYMMVLKDGSGGIISGSSLVCRPGGSSELRLKLSSSKSFYKNGDSMVLDAVLTNAAGVPVSGAEVSFSFAVCQAGLEPAYKLGCSGARAVSGFEEFKKLPQRKVYTDSSGLARIKLICPDAADERADFAAVRVTAEAVSGQGHRTEAVRTFAVSDNNCILTVRGPETAAKGASCQYLVQAVAVDGSPVSGAKLIMSALDEQGSSFDLGSCVTDECGQACFSWKPEKVGAYTVKLAAKDKKSGTGRNSVSSQGKAEIGLEGVRAFCRTRVVNGQDMQLCLEPSARMCKAGDTIQFGIVCDPQINNVLISYGLGDCARRFLVEPVKGRASLAVPVSQAMAPGFRISAAAVYRGKLHTAGEQISVFDPDSVIKVKASWDNAPAGGQTAKLKIDTSDNSGKPLASFVNAFMFGPSVVPLIQNGGAVSYAGGFSGNFRIWSGLPDFECGCSGSSREHASSEGFFGRFADELFLGFGDDYSEAGEAKSGEDGSASLEVKLPDYDGTCSILVNASSASGASGRVLLPLEFKSGMAVKVNGPSMLNSGDFAKFAVNISNHSGNSEKLKVSAFTEGGNVVRLYADGLEGSERTEFPEFELKGHASKKLEFTVKSGLPGSGSVILEVRNEAGSRRYEHPVEVRPMVTVFREDASGSVQREETLHLDSFRKEFIGRVFDRTLNIDLMNGPAGVLAISSFWLDELSSASGEETLARWAVPVVCRRAFERGGLKVPEGMQNYDERDKELADAMRLLQNADGGFGWRGSVESDPVITTLAARYLNLLSRSGEKEAAPMAKAAEGCLKRLMPGMDISRKLLCSLAFAEPVLSDADLLKAVKEFDKLDSPSSLALIDYLERFGRRPKAGALWKKFCGRTADKKASSGKAGAAKGTPAAGSFNFEGNDIFSSCKTAAIALNINIKLGGSKEYSDKCFGWLMEHRSGCGWASPSDTLAALEAVSAYMNADGGKAEGSSYGVWINGNELESNRGLDENSSWCRRISLEVAQLPDSPLNVKFVKSGSGRIWVHADESLVVHGLPEAGWSVGSVPAKAQEAQFSISNACFVSDGKGGFKKLGEPGFVHLGSPVMIKIDTSCRRSLFYADIDLPRLGSFEIDRVEGLAECSGSFDRTQNRISVPRMSKGSHVFKVFGHLGCQGEFTADPAQIKLRDSSHGRAWAAPFTVSIGE